MTSVLFSFATQREKTVLQLFTAADSNNHITEELYRAWVSHISSLDVYLFGVNSKKRYNHCTVGTPVGSVAAGDSGAYSKDIINN